MGRALSFHHVFATRSGTKRVTGDSAVRLVRVTAFLGLGVLLAGLALPLVSLVLVDKPAPSCCTRGRCCCADGATAGDERTCVRRGCGCEHRNDAVNGEPLRIEAVLPAPAPVPAAAGAQVRWASLDEQPIARADRPRVPPPKRPLQS